MYPYVIPKLKGKDVIDVSSGHAHSAALCANGDLYCWGDGDCGQTGTQNILELLPQKVDLYNIMPSLDKVVTIGCGPFHTVVGTKFGHVYSWGQNSVGALGIGDNVAESAHHLKYFFLAQMVMRINRKTLIRCI